MKLDKKMLEDFVAEASKSCCAKTAEKIKQLIPHAWSNGIKYVVDIYNRSAKSGGGTCMHLRSESSIENVNSWVPTTSSPKYVYTNSYYTQIIPNNHKVKLIVTRFYTENNEDLKIRKSYSTTQHNVTHGGMLVYLDELNVDHIIDRISCTVVNNIKEVLC